MVIMSAFKLVNAFENFFDLDVLLLAEDSCLCFEKFTCLEFQFTPVLKRVEALAFARDSFADELPAFGVNYWLVD